MSNHHLSAEQKARIEQTARLLRANRANSPTSVSALQSAFHALTTEEDVLALLAEIKDQQDEHARLLTEITSHQSQRDTSIYILTVHGSRGIRLLGVFDSENAATASINTATTNDSDTIRIHKVSLGSALEPPIELTNMDPGDLT